MTKLEMCYDGALVMPSNYAVMNEEEMTYVEGGWATWQKVLVGAAIVAVGIGVIAALAYGQVWLISAIMKITFSQAVKKLGIKGVAAIVAESTGFGVASIAWGLNKIF